MESLEDRCLLSVFTVNTNDDLDDGVADAFHTSLREAINAANLNAGEDRIEFAIPDPGPYTIQPLTALPPILGEMTIDGTTQQGYSGTPIVEIDGSLAGDVFGL